jgi:[protein-PII] uridylyltransferase
VRSPARALPPDAQTLQLAIERDGTVAASRAYLEQLRDALDRRYLDGDRARDLINDRARGVDLLLQTLWRQQGLSDRTGLCLVAVGGYGRRELHPCSDVDLLLLTDQETHLEAASDRIQSFLTLLWDTGLEVGHSVRHLEQCAQAADEDLTIVTNLLESRPIAGDRSLHRRLKETIDTAHMWDSGAFYRAKREEQLDRHRRFTQSEYLLEPNLKNSPGGLRDIQMIGWVAKRHFSTRTIRELVEQGFVTRQEYDALVEGQEFLWKLRYGLHMLAGREEDRLLFEHQRELARLFGYRDDERGLGVEHFMMVYYRWALRLGTLNDMLMQLLDEQILRACEPVETYELNRRFRIRNGFIEVSHDRVFRDSPHALLEVFLLLAQHEQIEGIRAATIRLILEHLHLIDENFNRSRRNNLLFLKLLRSPHKVSTQLRRMHRYGVLGRFIPEFGRIVGMMQHDLFHIYTVDAHTLQVIKNMRRFTYPDERERFPIAAQAVERLPKIELLFLAGLFHDLAKGRGGDHSQLGAVDAEAFCLRLGLSGADARLVAWLVAHHLDMSTSSQRKDLSDPEVIRGFASLVQDRRHLDYLYALTVADINATNPSLWNSFRASLLRTLYHETRRALHHGLENTVDRHEVVEETQHAARRQLQRLGHERDSIDSLFAHLGGDYFLRESLEDVVRQCAAILQHRHRDAPLVLLSESGTRFDGVTQIFMYTRDRPHLFAAIAACLERLALNVQGARIYNSFDQHILDSFFVLEDDGRPVGDEPRRRREIVRALEKALAAGGLPAPPQRFTPRRLKDFRSATQTTSSTDANTGCTVLEVITSDRPGLLATIGRVFVEQGIQVHNARIATLGERVEDIFFITGRDGRPLPDDGELEQLRSRLREALDAGDDSA